MTAPPSRDLAATREALSAWLERTLQGASDLSVSALSAPGATGFSNETLFFDLGYARGEARRWARAIRPGWSRGARHLRALKPSPAPWAGGS